MTSVVPTPSTVGSASSSETGPRTAARPDSVQAVSELTARIRGPVHGPSDVGTVTELAGFNLAAEHAPLAVVGAVDTEDVAAAVGWAAERGVPVAVVGTGHGSWSHRDVLVVSTKRLDTLDVDPAARIARVGAGVRWRQVLDAAAPHGLVGLCGSSSDVGVVGYTLGGGHGPLVRSFGWAADRVRRFTLVTGDGRVHDVTPGSELFRATLGSKDVLGIVTELEFELVELSGLYGGAIFYDGADASAVLRAYVAWAASLDEQTNTSIAILRLPDLEMLPPPLRGRCVVHLRYAHVGDAAEGQRRLAAMRAVATPLMDTVDDLPVAALDAIHMDPPEPMPSWETGAYLHTFDDDAVDRLLAAAGPQHELPVIVVEVRHVDGPGSRGNVGCVGREGARWTLGIVTPMVPELRDVAPAIGHGILDAMAPWSTGRTPINWVSPQTAEARPGRGWTDEDRRRLADVARRHDPSGVLGARRFGAV